MEHEREHSRELSPPDITFEQAMQLSKRALSARLLEVQVDRRRLLEEGETDQKLRSMLTARVITERVEQRIGRGEAFGLFYVDLDNFKHYNDTYLHIEGDYLLDLLEVIFNETFRRENDEVASPFTLGRMGGDEFLLLMADIGPGGRRSSDLMEQMGNVLAMLRDAEARLLEAEPRAREVGVGFSIGYAVYDPADPVDAKTLIKRSEEVMYAEKKERQAQLKERGLYTER